MQRLARRAFSCSLPGALFLIFGLASCEAGSSDSTADIAARDTRTTDISPLPDIAARDTRTTDISPLPDLIAIADTSADLCEDIVEPDVQTPPDLMTPWEPEDLSEHPRLFFSTQDLPALRERAAAKEGPHALIFATLKSYAQRDLATNDGEHFDHALSIRRSESAEAAALVGEIEEDPILVQKAAELLAAPFTLPAGEMPVDNYGLHEAEALVGWCTAYDIVAGSAHVDDNDKAAARERLIERVRTYRSTMSSPYFLAVYGAVFNNHPAKVLSALGLCALSVNDHDQAALDLHDGLTGFLYIFQDFQASIDGGFGEGWNYLTYGDNNYLPFVAAYHRYARGRTLPYWTVGTFTASRDENVGSYVDVLDPAADPAFRIVYERALESSFPNGKLPNTDDANTCALHGGLLAALFEDGRFLDNWLRPAVSAWHGRTRLATFTTLDPAMETAPPDWEADQFHYEAGFALMRSDLSDDALWLLVQGEHGTVRIGGVGHEHPDATNVLLWYRGEPLLIDPGYIKWDHHDLVCQATDHNLILVDGAGPPYPALGANVGVDAFLEDWTQEARLTSVSSRARWSGVDVKRRVVRVDGRFFILADELTPADEQSHRYTYQMNGMGGGDLGVDTFALLNDGARWVGTNASVDVRVLPVVGEPAYASRPEEHATGYGQWALHDTLTVDVDATADAGFLSIILPVAHDESAPVATMEKTREGLVTADIEWDDVRYRVAYDRADGVSIWADDVLVGDYP